MSIINQYSFQGYNGIFRQSLRDGKPVYPRQFSIPLLGEHFLPSNSCVCNIQRMSQKTVAPRNSSGGDDIEDTIVDSCRVCSNIITRKEGSKHQWDKIIFEADNYVCTPTIGALTEGYVLTIPKPHHLCSGQMDEDRLIDYWDFTRKASNVVQKEYGDGFIFEHGPVEEHTNVGCGVDHAHMHVVPFSGGDLMKIASDINPTGVDWRDLSSIVELRDVYKEGNEYLLTKRRNEPPVVGTSEVIISQLFRRAIATKLGAPKQYDWNEMMCKNNVDKTLDQLEGKDI